MMTINNYYGNNCQRAMNLIPASCAGCNIIIPTCINCRMLYYKSLKREREIERESERERERERESESRL